VCKGVLARLGAGESFGERALMLDEPRFATCVAAQQSGGRTRCLRLERAAFEHALSNVQVCEFFFGPSLFKIIARV